MGGHYSQTFPCPQLQVTLFFNLFYFLKILFYLFNEYILLCQILVVAYGILVP